MDPKIWSNLPTELIKKIIEESSPSIDTQLCFKISPKKIDEAKSWRLWYLLKSHDGIVYNLETESLHIFRIPGYHIIRRRITLDWVQDYLWCFNEVGKEHMIEMTTASGSFIGIPCKNPWITEMRVLLKGSGLARVLNVSGSSS
jgi:hypothetical protein